MKNPENSYKCEKCKDTSWVETPNGFKRCECYEKEQAARIWTASGINPDQTKMTFSNYITENEVQKKAKDTATKYYRNFKNIKDTRYNSIAFLGQVGSGKTHLSIALAVNMLSKGIAVKYMPYRDTITKIKMNMKDDEYYHKLLGQFQTAKVLLIDDLFKGKINESDINIMFELINYRYNNYLPLIVSSEFDTNKLLDFDEAVGSRIIEMCRDYLVEFEGKENNYRMRDLI